MAYLHDEKLLLEDGYEHKTYCYDGLYVGVLPYSEDEDDKVRIAGESADGFICETIPRQELRRWKLDEEKFLKHVLNCDLLGIRSIAKKSLDVGCWKLADIPQLGVSVFFCETGSERSLFRVEQACGKAFGKSTVIITAGDELDAPYDQYYAQGRFQHVPLSTLLAVNEDGEFERQLLSEQLVYKNIAQDTKPPYAVYPGEIEWTEWKDISLSFTQQQVSVKIGKKPPRTFNHGDFIVFSRAANSRTAYGAKMDLLLAIAYAKAWHPFGTKERQTLRHLNAGLRQLFSMPSNFYRKDKDGLYRSNLTLNISPDLEAYFSKPEVRNALDGAFNFEERYVTRNGKTIQMVLPTP